MVVRDGGSSKVAQAKAEEAAGSRLGNAESMLRVWSRKVLGFENFLAISSRRTNHKAVSKPGMTPTRVGCLDWAKAVGKLPHGSEAPACQPIFSMIAQHYSKAGTSKD